MIKQFMKTVANEIVVHFCIWVGIWWHQRLAPTWQWYGSPPSTSKWRHTERGSAREALWWHRRPREVNKNEITCMFYEVRQKVSVKMFIYHKIFYAWKIIIAWWDILRKSISLLKGVYSFPRWDIKKKFNHNLVPFVLSMPETKTSSVANRQNTRFLWIEFLSPCNDLKKTNKC